MKNENRLIATGLAAAVGAWFVVARTMGVKGKYQTRKNEPPAVFGLTIVTPMVGLVTLYRLSPAFRRFCRSVDLKALALPHIWRLRGAEFLLQYRKGRLPGAFAWPAAVGDVLAALGAPVVFRLLQTHSPASRKALIAWNTFGAADLAVALTSGILHSQSSFGALAKRGGILAKRGPTTRIMSEHPRSLIPTFFVPVFLLLHFLSLDRAGEVAEAPAVRAAA
jgi:hypothetical protein